MREATRRRRARKQWIIGAIFSCATCGKDWQDYKSARQSARRHARSTGHPVTGEVTCAVQYAAPSAERTDGGARG